MAPTIQTPADLTDIEIACGVTTDQVIAEAARSLVIDNGEKVVVETHHGPQEARRPRRVRRAEPARARRLPEVGLLMRIKRIARTLAVVAVAASALSGCKTVKTVEFDFDREPASKGDSIEAKTDQADLRFFEATVVLSDGREVVCLENRTPSSSGGLSCDWENAAPSDGGEG